MTLHDCPECGYEWPAANIDTCPECGECGRTPSVLSHPEGVDSLGYCSTGCALADCRVAVDLRCRMLDSAVRVPCAGTETATRLRHAGHDRPRGATP